jgi:hypothetical protein
MITKVICLAACTVLPITSLSSAYAADKATVPTVTISHISTAYANRGMCSIRFGLGTAMGDGDAGDISVMLKFIDKNGKPLYQGVIGASLSDSEAGRYQEVFLEDEDICFDSSTRVQVVQATATPGKKKFNLIKLHKIVVDDFRPYTISIPK